MEEQRWSLEERGSADRPSRNKLITQLERQLILSSLMRRVMKMTMIAEGAEAKRVEDAVEKRKRKVEDDKRWEGAFRSCSFPGSRLILLRADSREDRVTDWRSFQKGPKRKKAKDNVLG